MKSSKERIVVRWQGSALEENLIDVRDLAPALIALGDLCVAANRVFNKDKAGLKVLVSADDKQSSFVLEIIFMMEIFEQIKDLLGSDPVTTLKEILEWLDLMKVGGTVATGAGIFGLIKLLRGKTVLKVENRDARDNVNLVIQDNTNGNIENITINNNVYVLAQDPRASDAAQRFIKPIIEQNGIDAVSVYSGDNEIMKLESNELDENLLESDLFTEEEEVEDESVNEVEYWCRLRRPVFDDGAKNWQFEINGDKYSVDISETDILETALRKGTVGVEDMYKLKLEEKQVLTRTGTKLHYKAIEVMQFRPSQTQTSLL